LLVEQGVSPTSERVSLTLVGRSGSVEPGATLRVTNLEDAEPALATTADDTGGFHITVSVFARDQLRIQVETAAGRSQPTDVSARAEGVAAVERIECVVIEPGLGLALGSAETTRRRALTLDNTCAEPVTVSALRARLGVAGFSADGAVPLTLAPGASASIEFAVEPAGTGARDEVFFFDLAHGAVTRRYAVSVWREF
jgi:hypothetical protein